MKKDIGSLMRAHMEKMKAELTPKRVEANRLERYQRNAPLRQTMSLKALHDDIDQLDIGVPFIRCTSFHSISMKTAWKVIDNVPDDVALQEVQEFNIWLSQQNEHDRIVREQYCSGEDLKMRLSDGRRAENPQHAATLAGDSRIIECANDFGEESLVFIARERLNPRVLPSGHPVEWRCFVTPQHVTISSYYPQAGYSALSENHAAQMRHACLRLREVTPMPEFTADFIEDDQGEVWLLERGPSLSSGMAHPCCLNPRKALDGRVACEPEEGSPLYEQG